MEAHHPHVEKKKFKDFLLEGLMIFIAVTMGFFAESLRERIADNKKEKEYIVSLMSDLQQDSVFLRSTIKENKWKLKGLDSLLTLATKDMNKPANRTLLYKYASNSVSFYSAFGSNDATMMQLKSSGGLQYIKHNHVADSIAMYDQATRSIYAAEKPYAKAIDNALDVLSQVIVYSVDHDSSYYNNGKYNGKNLPLLATDPKELAIFFNKISAERGWTQNYLNNINEKLPYNTHLMALIKKEYGFDEPETRSIKSIKPQTQKP